MKHFTIENETNNITVHAAAKEAEAVPNAERFSNEAELAKVAADWRMARLVEVWNSLPGVTPVTKLKDHSTAIARIWKAIENWSAAETEGTVQPEVETVPGDGAADVAPQSAPVAPEEPVAGEGTTPPAGTLTEPVVDKNQCEESLKNAAAMQSAFWAALRELERATGCELDSRTDFENVTVEQLLERRPKRRPRPAGAKTPRENSKTSQVIAILKRVEGASLEEIMAAMGWQKHTTRAMLSAGGSLVKNHGLTITSDKVGEQKRYYIRG